LLRQCDGTIEIQP